jgi:S1-C subfamily serine protease
LALPVVLLFLAISAGVGGLGWWLLQRVSPSVSKGSAALPQAARDGLWPEERARAELFAARRSAVVNIDTAKEVLGSESFPGSANRMPVGLGSGVLWDLEGHVLTNRHVLAGANAALVRLADGSQWRASLVGVAVALDLAVLAIDAPPERLSTIPLGRSSDLVVGQSVLAIGSPFGLDWTLTTGVVSGLERVVEGADELILEGLIQTDAAINPGNSGGPLLDSSGRLVGLNTAVAQERGGGPGFGFAVPVEALEAVVPRILELGNMPRAGLGVRLLEDRLTHEMGLEGALIAVVLVGSPAERAGLQAVRRDAEGRLVPGDLIVAVAGQPIRNNRDLARALEGREVGESLELALQRGQQTRVARVILGDTLPLAPIDDPAPAGGWNEAEGLQGAGALQSRPEGG